MKKHYLILSIASLIAAIFVLDRDPGSRQGERTVEGTVEIVVASRALEAGETVDYHELWAHRPVAAELATSKRLILADEAAAYHGTVVRRSMAQGEAIRLDDLQ